MNTYVRIYFLSKYLKDAEGLQINISHFDIHHGLPWKTLFIYLHLMGFNTPADSSVVWLSKC